MDKFDKANKLQTRYNQILWILFVLVNLGVYMFFSSGDFSFILTLAAGIQCFGFGLVIFTVYKSGDVAGISWNTFCCCGLALLGRLISIMIFEGYLPVDKTGDHIYKVFEVLSLIFCLMTLAFMKNSLTRYSQEQLEFLKWYYIVPPMFVLAYFIHPGLNQFSPLDILWMFGLNLECFALLPQILLFQKTGEVENHTSNFVVTQVISKIIGFVFWCTSYQELNEGFNEGTMSVAPWLSGYFVLADFLYLYLKSWKTGIPIAHLPH